MWRYVLIHTLLFCILFLVHFFGGRRDRTAVGLWIAGAAFFLAWRGFMDPFAWFFYVLYSLVTFVGSGRFRAWALIRLDLLTSGLKKASSELEELKGLLAHRRQETQALEKRASEISVLYDRVKDMSRCLDPFEAFWILGAALAGHFSFESLTLLLMDPNPESPREKPDCFAVPLADLRVPRDSQLVYQEKEKFRAPFTELDDRVLHRFQSGPARQGPPRRNSFSGAEPEFASAFTAFPVYVDSRLVAVLTLVRPEARDLPLYHILIERFAGEIQRIYLYEQVQMLATHDGLTEVYGRRHLLERLEGEIGRCQRQGLPLSFLMIDLDHFKKVNDHYGHLAGDAVLKSVAQVIKKNVREADLVGRYGGEEFGVILFEADRAAALTVAERIRRGAEENKCQAFGALHRVTVSIGLAWALNGEKEAKTLIDEADQALYRAKADGRNAVRVWEA